MMGFIVLTFDCTISCTPFLGVVCAIVRYVKFDDPPESIPDLSASNLKQKPVKQVQMG